MPAPQVGDDESAGTPQQVYIPPSGASSLVSMAHFCPGLHGPDVRKDVRTLTFRAFFEELRLQQLPTGPAQLVIPLFQRTYCWTSELTAAWWRDVTRAAAATGRGGGLANSAAVECHRVGQVILKRWNSGARGGGGGDAGGQQEQQQEQQEEEQRQQVWVLDGQQRLTTTILLVAALRDAALSLASAAGLRSTDTSPDDDGEAFSLKDLVAGLERCL
jgi:hypothetical protein